MCYKHKRRQLEIRDEENIRTAIITLLNRYKAFRFVLKMASDKFVH